MSTIAGSALARARRRSRAGPGPSRARRAGCARRSRGRSRSPAPSRSQRNESTVPSRSVPASRALATAVVVLEQPGELAGREVRVERHAAALAHLVGAPVRLEPVEHLLGALVLPGRRSGSAARPLSASQASTDSPWWSSPQATTSPGASAEHLRDRLDHGGEHLLGVLLDPAGLRVASAFSRRASRTGRRSRVEQHRLDGGGALVDARAAGVMPALGTRPFAATTGRRAPAVAPRLERSLRAERHAELGDDRADALRDPERRGQPGGADRRHVDEARAGARRADQRS